MCKPLSLVSLTALATLLAGCNGSSLTNSPPEIIAVGIEGIVAPSDGSPFLPPFDRDDTIQLDVTGIDLDSSDDLEFLWEVQLGHLVPAFRDAEGKLDHKKSDVQDPEWILEPPPDELDEEIPNGNTGGTVQVTDGIATDSQEFVIAVVEPDAP